MIMIRIDEAARKSGGGDGKQLHDYWTKSAEGLAKWASSPHPWTALHSHLVKHMNNPDMAARVTSAWYHDVFGVWPGTKQKKGKGKSTRPAVKEAATHPPPYEWSHGWVPLTPKAKAIKAHKKPGDADSKKPRVKVDGEFEAGDRVKMSGPWGNGTVERYEVKPSGERLVHVKLDKDGKTLTATAKSTKHLDDDSAPAPKPINVSTAKQPVVPQSKELGVDRPEVERAKDRVAKIGMAKGSRSTRHMSSALSDLHDEQNDSSDGWLGSLDQDERDTVRSAVNAAAAAPIQVRTSTKGIAGILETGRFKSSHEIGSSGAGSILDDDEYGDMRREYELEFMETDGVPDSEAPIYGYAGDSDTAKLYGGVVVTLKPAVRSRTTATVGDSLSGFPQPYPIDAMSTLSDAQFESAMSNDETSNLTLTNGKFSSYLETQVHGGVGLDDIESVELPGDMRDSDTAKGLASRGIKVKFSGSAAEAVLAALTEAATHPGPYQWRHGWIPLTPRAKAIKKKKIEGSARGKKHPDGGTGGGLPKAGHTGKVGVKHGGNKAGDEKPSMKVAVPKAAAKQLVPKATVKLPVAKPTSTKNQHGIDTSKIKMHDVISDGYGSDVKVVKVNDDGSVSGLKKNAFGDNVFTTVPADSVKYHSSPSAAAPTAAKPKAAAKPSITNMHGVDISKIKAGDVVISDYGEKIQITDATPNEYGQMIGEGQFGEVYVSTKTIKSHQVEKPNSFGVNAGAIKPGDAIETGGQTVFVTHTDDKKVYGKNNYGASVGVYKSQVSAIHAPSSAKRPDIPNTNSPHDDHNFKLPGGFQYGSEGFREVPPSDELGFTASERSAVRTYTGHKYSDINDQLRTGKNNYMEPTIKNLDAAFAKTPPLETGVRMRRLMGDTDRLFGPVGSKVGGTFSDKGYVSTTHYHDPTEAGSFAGSDVTIDMPPGVVALRPDGAGEFQDAEGEVLLPRDTQFRVKGDYVDEYGERKIHLEVIVP